MAKAPFENVLGYLIRASAANGAGELSDRQLLDRIQSLGQETVFTFLIKRHGRMVYSVARRALGDAHDAEDVFQATFLVMARRLSSIHGEKSVGGWLHGVAQRIAWNLRVKAIRRRRNKREMPMRELPANCHIDAEIDGAELRAILDAEIGALAEKYRTPLVLCYLEGRSYDQAARELGCPKSTLASRLTKALDLLRVKLERRGIELTAAALAATLGGMAEAAPVSAVLAANTMKAAALATIGKSAIDGFVTTSALALTKQALAGAAWIKKVLMVAAVLGLAASGFGWAEYAASSPEDARPRARVIQHGTTVRTVRAIAADPEPRVDQQGDPLPDFATQRFGTARFRPGGLVYACAFSPDGKFVLAATDDQGVAVFDADKGRLVRRLGDRASNGACVFSPDGAFVAASIYGSIFRWDWSTGVMIRAINTPQEHIASLSFTPDGKQILSAGQDKTLRLWDVATSKEIANFEGHEAPVHSVAITPDGRFAASGSRDMTVRLWEIATGKMVREFTGNKPVTPTNEFTPVAFSHDGKWLATSDGKPGVCVFEVATGKLEFRLPYAKQEYRALAFSHDDKMVAAGSATRQFMVWDLATRQLKQKREAWPSTSYRGWHWGGIPSVAFSPDDTRVAFAEDSRVALWDLVKGQDPESAELPAGAVHRVRFAGDGQSLVIASDDPRGPLVQWDVGTGQLRRRLRGNTSWPDTYDLSPDFGVIVFTTSDSDKHLSFCDTTSGKEVSKIELALKNQFQPLSPLMFSADGKWLAGAGNFADNTARVWDAASGKEVCNLDVRANRWKLAFAPDGKKLASTGNDQVLRIHDAATGKTLREWPNPSLQFANDGHICFSPDGNLLATLGRKEVQFRPLPSNEQAVRLWEAKTGKLWRLLDIGNSRVMTTCAPTFSPNGRMLVSADADGAIQLWEVATGKLRRLLPGHGGPITSLAFSPNGKSLASGSADTTALIWEAYAAPPNAKPQARDELWNLLASNDAAQAFAAMTTLIRMPKETAAYFKDHLAPVRVPDPKRIDALVAALASEDFRTRQDASNELAKLGDLAEAGLRQALAKQPALEVRQRLELLLTKLDDAQGGDILRAIRAVDILEALGTQAANAHLETLAKGSPGYRLTVAAEETLKRRGTF